MIFNFASSRSHSTMRRIAKPQEFFFCTTKSENDSSCFDFQLEHADVLMKALEEFLDKTKTNSRRDVLRWSEEFSVEEDSKSRKSRKQSLAEVLTRSEITYFHRIKAIVRWRSFVYLE